MLLEVKVKALHQLPATDDVGGDAPGPVAGEEVRRRGSPRLLPKRSRSKARYPLIAALGMA